MSPVKNLRMSAPDVGRIRLGDEKKPNRPGQPLDTLRFTSDDDVVLKSLAEQFGGEVKDWTDGEQAYQLMSGTAQVNVLVRSDSLDVNYEAWAKGGISRRCDSETCLLPSPETGMMSERPCWCLANGMVPGEDKDACRFTVRLRLLLPEVPGLGQWTMTTHSTIAGSEISAQFSMMAAELGAQWDWVHAVLAIDDREIKRPQHPDPKRRKDAFLVPVLRFQNSLSQLAEIAVGARAIESGARELGAAPSFEERLIRSQATIEAAHAASEAAAGRPPSTVPATEEHRRIIADLCATLSPEHLADYKAQPFFVSVKDPAMTRDGANTAIAWLETARDGAAREFSEEPF